MKNLFNATYDFFFVKYAREVSWLWMSLAIIFLVVTQSGCASSAAGKVVDVATVPGTDKRCIMGFCYEREREVDVEALEALTEYLKAKDGE